MDRFAALADPTRRQIVEMLGNGERTAGAIVENFAVSAPAISQHLRTLREAGLVRVRIDGPRRIYSLDPDGLAEVEAWMSRLRPFWAARLDRLQSALDEKGKDDGERS